VKIPGDNYFIKTMTMKSNQPGLLTSTKTMIYGFVTFLFILMLSGSVAYPQIPGAKYASLGYQKTTPVSPTEFRNDQGVTAVKYSEKTDSEGLGNIPEFAMGSTSEQYQSDRLITYDAISKNANVITYSLDNESEEAGNIIDPQTGAVTFIGEWTGTTTITATATDINGKKYSSTHTVSVHPLPIASTSTNQTIACKSSAIITGVTAENGSITWTHNGKGSLTGANTLHPVYISAAEDAGKTVQLTITVKSYYEDCGEKVATATCNVNVKSDDVH
jgi:hypothetical protein